MWHKDKKKCSNPTNNLLENAQIRQIICIKALKSDKYHEFMTWKTTPETMALSSSMKAEAS